MSSENTTNPNIKRFCNLFPSQSLYVPKRTTECRIAKEEMKKPILSKERITYWLTSFKSGDIENVEYRQRVIDTLVNSVFVYDTDNVGREIVLTFNISGSNTLTIKGSDIEGYAPPIYLTCEPVRKNIFRGFALFIPIFTFSQIKIKVF